MSRLPLMGNLARVIRIAHYCEANRISSRESLERVAAIEARAAEWRSSRREFLAGIGKVAAMGVAGYAVAPFQRAFAASAPTVKVAVVGAGLAGLVCVDELKKSGIKAILYDADIRVGGRCWSLQNFFPGQVAERGGEFIDNLHKTMLGYAKAFKLTLEDVEKQPGEVFYFFNGQRFSEVEVVDEYRTLVAAMHDDLRTLSNGRLCWT
jgi:monoamine oxidase